MISWKSAPCWTQADSDQVHFTLEGNSAHNASHQNSASDERK